MNRRPTRTVLLTGAIAVAVGVGGVAGAGTHAVLSDDSGTVVREVTVQDAESAAASGVLSIAQIYSRSFKGVVEITASGGSSTLGGEEQQAQGSGFVFDRQGTIVTNQHVVDGAESIRIRLWNGKTYTAELVGTDPSTDLAVIKVDAPESVLEPLSLGDSNDLEVGATVVAIGSPFGLEGTVTSGIVSALHRQMTAPNNFTITDSIQTDAAINHGNSGGPLLDTSGRVVGVNAQIESESGGSDGIGFAIPSNTVRSIVSQLLESGTVEHAYLGVTMVSVPEGVAVTEVRAGTPAAKAGLRPATGTRTLDGQDIPTGGDVIVALDGAAVSSSAELQSAVDANLPGDTVSITVLRSGERKTIDVTLASRPS
ncbi:MAG: trypsin-like peptidase domain-containing protein [Actinobacteria bacterium]|nr:trypsin-like peptidase domain-containing protein [Actinomycetota bacterium]